MSSANNRRDFIKSMAATGLYLSAAPALSTSLSACANSTKLNFVSRDELKLVEGLQYRILIHDYESLGTNLVFGGNNDYLDWQPKDAKQFYFHVNHEHPTAYLQHGEKDPKKKTKQQVDIERAAIGTSLLILEKDKNQWQLNKTSSDSFRLNPDSEIPIAWGKTIRSKKTFTGTLANCAGGKTDWGTFLTCEENYDDFYGEVSLQGKRSVDLNHCKYGWERFYTEDPEQYGWVVEIDPKLKSAKKLIALGRFFHEGATFTRSLDGTPVVYMGDDKENEFLYKFISSQKNSLEEGKLYAANLEQGRWELLSLENPKLKGVFKSHTELLLRTREAARTAGATELDRPEDIVIGPNKEVYVALTNNAAKGRPHGRILKIVEEGAASTKLSASTFLEGSIQAGFSSPDNFALDAQGNIWLTSDMGYTETYKEFGRNALFVIPLNGAKKNQVIKVAEAPIHAEFTGPCFSPDGETLFVCVQHPGEKSDSVKGFTSSWPHRDPKRRPQSAVIEISGLKNLHI